MEFLPIDGGVFQVWITLNNTHRLILTTDILDEAAVEKIQYENTYAKVTITKLVSMSIVIEEV